MTNGRDAELIELLGVFVAQLDKARTEATARANAEREKNLDLADRGG